MGNETEKYQGKLYLQTRIEDGETKVVFLLSGPATEFSFPPQEAISLAVTILDVVRSITEEQEKNFDTECESIIQQYQSTLFH